MSNEPEKAAIHQFAKAIRELAANPTVNEELAAQGLRFDHDAIDKYFKANDVEDYVLAVSSGLSESSKPTDSF